jgi:hypothetical protein
MSITDAEVAPQTGRRVFGPFTRQRHVTATSSPSHKGAHSCWPRRKRICFGLDACGKNLHRAPINALALDQMLLDM